MARARSERLNRQGAAKVRDLDRVAQSYQSERGATIGCQYSRERANGQVSPDQSDVVARDLAKPTAFLPAQHQPRSALCNLPRS